MPGLPAEVGALDKLVRLVEVKQIDPKLAAERLVMLFHHEIGGVARALGVLDNAAAREVADQIGAAVAALSTELAQRAIGREAAKPVPFEARLSNKSIELLVREQLIMSSVAATNQDVPAKALLKAVREREPQVTDAAITATLERLVADQLLSRQHKGRYCSSLRSKDYLAALNEKIDRLGKS